MARRRDGRSQATPSLRQIAYDEIKRRILHAAFQPGTLLSENQIAEDLQISRTPIREALRDLAAGGLVRILPQRGIVVTEPSLQDVIEVYQLREQLECFAVRLTAERMGPDDTAGFRADHLLAMEHWRAGRLAKTHDVSILLHTRVVAMARNSRLTQFMQQLGDQVHRFGLLTLRHGRAEHALIEHGRIIEALAEGDADAAESLMHAHLRADRDMVIRLMLPAGVADADLLKPLAGARHSVDRVPA